MAQNRAQKKKVFDNAWILPASLVIVILLATLISTGNWVLDGVSIYHNRAPERVQKNIQELFQKELNLIGLSKIKIDTEKERTILEYEIQGEGVTRHVYQSMNLYPMLLINKKDGFVIFVDSAQGGESYKDIAMNISQSVRATLNVYYELSEH